MVSGTVTVTSAEPPSLWHGEHCEATPPWLVALPEWHCCDTAGAIPQGEAVLGSPTPFPWELSSHPTGIRSHSHVSGKYTRGAGGSSLPSMWLDAPTRTGIIALTSKSWYRSSTPEKGRAELEAFRSQLDLACSQQKGDQDLFPSSLMPRVLSGWLQVPLRTEQPGLATSSLLFSAQGICSPGGPAIPTRGNLDTGGQSSLVLALVKSFSAALCEKAEVVYLP